MPPWWIKAAVQGGLSLLPRSERLNEAFQQHVTHTIALTPARFEAKVGQARRHLRRHARATDGALPGSVLELGTGWYPIVPVALAVSGVPHTISIDLHPLVSAARTREVLERFAGHARSDALRPLLPTVTEAGVERLDAALAGAAADATAGDLLAPLGVELRRGDARESGLPAGSIDLFVSNNTFEHIPAEVLRGLAAEFARLAAPGAVMDHFVDMRDHYSSFDGSISRLNYLRYPDPVWRVFNNRLQYQNRLRLPDYRAILEEAGFAMIAEHRREGRAGEFDGLRVARRFRQLPREDREVLFVWLTAQWRGGSRQPPVSPR